MPVVLNKRLLDAKEAAKYLSISRTKLYEWANRDREPRIPSIKLDSCRLFDVLELDKFVEDLKTEQRKKGRA